jgi:hypothetical protein
VSTWVELRIRQAKALGKRGAALVGVVMVPIGPRCCVLTPDGKLVHGYLPPEDWQPCTSELLHTGYAVTAVMVNDLGTVLTDPVTGAILLEHVGDGKLRPATQTERKIRWRIRATTAPARQPGWRK